MTAKYILVKFNVRKNGELGFVCLNRAKYMKDNSKIIKELVVDYKYIQMIICILENSLTTKNMEKVSFFGSA